MERDLAGAALSPQDFQRLAAACRDDSKFPKTYEAWQSLVNTGTAELLAQGQQVKVFGVVVDDFLAWCNRVQVVPCLDALRAYMILLRRTQDAGEVDSADTAAPAAKKSKAPRNGKKAIHASRRLILSAQSRPQRRAGSPQGR